MRRLFTAAAVAAAVWVALPLSGLLADSWEREFTANIGSQDSNVRYLAVKKLDPSIPKARAYLFGVLGQQDWYLRRGAIDVLAGASGDTVGDLQKEAKSNKVPQVREGIVSAFGLMKSPERVPDLVAALGDKHPDVRRTAVHGIVAVPTKEGVTAIVEAWEKEKDWTVAVFYKDALEKLTKNHFGWQVIDWKNWWTAKKDKWKPPKPKKEKKEGEPEEPEAPPEESGEEKTGAEGGEGKEKAEESTTVMRDVELNFRESGKGPPLFVLPALYRNRLYLERHMQSLEDSARLFYIDLPPLSKFRGLKNLGVSGKPYYPLTEVCDAFDELRKERKHEKIAILAHEMAAWVAMRYATKYPNNVSHLILVSTWPSNRAWSDGRMRVENDGRGTKNVERERYAKSRVANPDTGKSEYEAKDPQEAEALDRAGWTVQWGDPKNMFAEMWHKPTFVDMGGCWIPEFDIAKERPGPVPTLVVYGAKSLWSREGEATVLSKVYSNSQVLACPGSADFPMIEDHDQFTKAVKAFFKRYPIRKTGGEKKDK